MRVIFAVATIAGLAANLYWHYQYALANYPKSRYWYLRILGTAFVTGSAGFLALPASLGTAEFLFAVGGGVLMGAASLFLFPHSVQYVILKRIK